MNSKTSERLLIDPECVGKRLDVFLVERFEREPVHPSGTVSRSEIQRLIAHHQITLNGMPTKPSARLRATDYVDLQFEAPRDATPIAEALPLDIVFEDNDCIVINKASGMTVHPGAGHWTGTLANALLYRCPDLEGIGGIRRPGIVHRLDKDTSGVMIAAKTAMAHQHLVLQFKNRTVEKEYIALAWGNLKESSGVIDRPIGRHRSDRKKMSSMYRISRSRAARTEWIVEERFHADAEATLLRLRPRTGRMHQLRVHLADLGHPLVGDPVYGRKHSKLSAGNQEIQAFGRQALHSHRLSIFHPRSKQRMTFIATLPADMAALLAALRNAESTAVQQHRSARG